MIHRREKDFSSAFPRYLDNTEPLFQHSNHFPVRTVTFVVTESCNLQCSYCYEHNKIDDKVMSREVAMKAVDALLDPNSSIRKYIDTNEQTRALTLDFIGGEPLLQIDLIDYICDYWKYQVYQQNHQFQNYMFSISTNGVLYDTPEVQKFIKKNQRRLSVSISIDGYKEQHDSCRKFPDGRGSFDIVYPNTKKAVNELGLKSTKSTISPENLKYLSVNVPWLIEQCGLTSILTNVVFENVWENEHAQVFYQELIKLADWLLEGKRYENYYISLFEDTIGHSIPLEENNNWCGGTGLMLAIGTDGGLYPCIRYMNYSLSDTRPELKIGDVWNGIGERQEEKDILNCMECITRRSQSTDECFNCPVASGCAWCSGYNYDVFGTPDKRTTFICKMFKARVLANYYFWNSLYKLEHMDKFFTLNLSQEEIDFLTCGKQIKRFEAKT